MPCYDAPPTTEELSRWNAERYGVHCTYEQMMRDIACAAMGLLEASGQLAQTSGHAQRWYAEHKRVDAERAARGGDTA